MSLTRLKNFSLGFAMEDASVKEKTMVVKLKFIEGFIHRLGYTVFSDCSHVSK